MFSDTNLLSPSIDFQQSSCFTSSKNFKNSNIFSHSEDFSKTQEFSPSSYLPTKIPTTTMIKTPSPSESATEKIETPIKTSKEILKTSIEKTEAITLNHPSISPTKSEMTSIMTTRQDITSIHLTKPIETSLVKTKLHLTSPNPTKSELTSIRRTTIPLTSIIQTKQQTASASQTVNRATLLKTQKISIPRSRNTSLHSFISTDSSTNDVPNALIKEQKTSTGKNVGIIVGVLLLIVIVILIILYIYFRRRINADSNNGANNRHTEETNSYDMDEAVVDSEMSFLTMNDGDSLMTDIFFTHNNPEHESEDNNNFFDQNYEEIIIDSLTNH